MDIDQAVAAVKQFENEFGMLTRNPLPSIRSKFSNLKETALELATFLEDQRPLFAPLSGDLDLSDLPPELLSELTAAQPDELETQIISVVKAHGGNADLDQMLVGLYRKFKVLQKRRFLQNKVWRLTKKGAIFAVPGKRGVYTLKRPPPSEAEFQAAFQDALDEIR